MRSDRGWILSIVALLVTVAGLLLAIVATFDAPVGILQILALVAGATFFSGLALLLAAVQQPRSRPLIQVSFNEYQLRQDLQNVIDAEFREIQPARTQPWEPTADKLITEDPVLALAKVRIDLEREIRRYGLNKGIIRPDQRFNMRHTLDGLIKLDGLPKAAVNAIRDILPVCNRAIHGEPVDTATAQKVIDLSAEVLLIIRDRSSVDDHIANEIESSD